jgi:hypothetical protein
MKGIKKYVEETFKLLHGQRLFNGVCTMHWECVEI